MRGGGGAGGASIRGDRGVSVGETGQSTALACVVLSPQTVPLHAPHQLFVTPFT